MRAGKFIIIFILCGISFGQTYTIEYLTTLYRNGDMDQISNILNKQLIHKSYWDNVLKTSNTKFGYMENIEYIFVSNKSKPDLSLYKKDKNSIELLGQTSALVGKYKGEKQKEGDYTTPIGVYELNARFTKLDQYYGPLALSTNYPNVFDKSLKKTGSGIWIHGLPLNGNREELNTRGCIAIDNDILTKYDSMIDREKSILITYEETLKEPSKDELAILLSSLFRWLESWKDGDIEQYLSFYDRDDFYRPDGSDFDSFASHKKRVFAKNERKEIILKDISVIPYPNERERNIYRISFMQDYKAYLGKKINYATKSKKDIYALLENGKVSFLTER